MSDCDSSGIAVDGKVNLLGTWLDVRQGEVTG